MTPSSIEPGVSGTQQVPGASPYTLGKELHTPSGTGQWWRRAVI